MNIFGGSCVAGLAILGVPWDEIDVRWLGGPEPTSLNDNLGLWKKWKNFSISIPLETNNEPTSIFVVKPNCPGPMGGVIDATHFVHLSTSNSTPSHGNRNEYYLGLCTNVHYVHWKSTLASSNLNEFYTGNLVRKFTIKQNDMQSIGNEKGWKLLKQNKNSMQFGFRAFLDWISTLQISSIYPNKWEIFSKATKNAFKANETKNQQKDIYTSSCLIH